MKSAIKVPRGLSLVELTAAMAIGSIILLLAAAMLARSGHEYEQLGGSLEAEREARALVGQISADLSSACFHPGAVFESPGSDWASDRIGFLCLKPEGAQSQNRHIGDLCAVHYYLEDLSIEGKTVRVLMRGFRDSADTFGALRDDELPELFSPEESVDEPLAFGVVSFMARPVTRGQDGRWSEWEASATTPPDAIDLRVVIARRSLAAKLSAPADWEGRGTHGRLLGNPSMAHRHPDLVTCAVHVPFGPHENPGS